MKPSRVLSIQSHVVRGYVGNKSAVFPLQVLGFEVDAINSVQLSNHTGYKCFKGQILNDNDLDDLLVGLKENSLDSYSHLLTGYVRSPSFLNRIVEAIKHLKKVNPNLIYVCDPVMGDNGKMYVPESLLPIYKDSIIPLADIVSLNQFELELLVEKPIKTIQDAWEGVEKIHSLGCKSVILSSCLFEPNGKVLTAVASHKENDKCTRVTMKIPKLEYSFTGTGDLFSALFLAWMHKTNNSLTDALDNTIATLQAVLQRTIKHALDESNGKPLTVSELELKLIQSKSDIENPQPLIHSEIVI